METLPIEILDRILDQMYPLDQYQYHSPIAPLATISPAWKKVVEARTFKNVTVSSRRLAQFEHVLSDRLRCGNTTHRQDIVKSIKLHIQLSPYRLADRYRAENDGEHYANKHHFTWAVMSFLGILSQWQRGSNIAIRIKVSSPTDISQDSWPRFGDWVKARVNNRFLNFTYIGKPLDSIKPVACITTFGACDGRKVHPVAVTKIWQFLPNLQCINTTFVQPDNRFKREKELERVAFGLSLPRISFASLTSLTLGYLHGYILNDDFQPGSGVPVGPDRLCRGINRICQEAPVEHLCLRDGFIISPELFTCPVSGAMWPRIKTVAIEMSELTGKGGWYTTGDIARVRGYGATEEDLARPEYMLQVENGEEPERAWRDSACSEEFDPLMRSAATAMLRMKSLQRLHLSGHWFDLRFDSNIPNIGDTMLRFTDIGFDRWPLPEEVKILLSQVTKQRGGQLECRHRR